MTSINTSSQAFVAATTDKGNNSVNNNSKNDDDDSYNPSSTLSCPPLVRLQVYGFCCPFIETEEEHDARACITNLQNYPITWYRKKRLSDVANDVKGAVPNATGLIDGIGSFFSGGGTTKQDSVSSSIPMTFVGVPATITILDTDDHGPVIQIRSLDDPQSQNALNNYITSGKPWWEDPIIKDKAPSKVVPLYMVDKVGSGWSLTSDTTAGGVKLYAAPQAKGFLSSGVGPELLRFDTLGGGGDSLWPIKAADEPNKYSDKIVVQLKSLVDWNRRRMASDIKNGRVGVTPKSNTSSGYITMS